MDEEVDNSRFDYMGSPLKPVMFDSLTENDFIKTYTDEKKLFIRFGDFTTEPSVSGYLSKEVKDRIDKSIIESMSRNQ